MLVGSGRELSSDMSIPKAGRLPEKTLVFKLGTEWLGDKILL